MKRVRYLLTLWVALSAVVLPASQAGEMYRWVDKDGKLHFSDKPPPADAKQSQQMALPASEPFSETSSEGDESAAERAARMRQTAEGIQADRVARQQQKAESTANKRKQEQACAAAKAAKNRFDTANLKYMVDENNQRRAMSDAEFDAVEKQLRADVEKACR